MATEEAAPLEQQQYDEGEMEHEESATTYQPLDVLAEHGIASNDLQKLQNAGYYTVESVSPPLNFARFITPINCMRHAPRLCSWK